MFGRGASSRCGAGERIGAKCTIDYFHHCQNAVQCDQVKLFTGETALRYLVPEPGGPSRVGK